MKPIHIANILSTLQDFNPSRYPSHSIRTHRKQLWIYITESHSTALSLCILKFFQVSCCAGCSFLPNLTKLQALQHSK